MIRTHETDGVWVVSDHGTWLPGIYESEAVARQAAALPDQALVALKRIYHIAGENRPVTADDLARLDEQED